MKNIVIFGGGTGTSGLLKGLKNFPVNLSVIISSWDDGGSNGRLRQTLKAFPFSDIRQCLAVLTPSRLWQKFFQLRFSQGELKGHTAGNLFLAGLEKTTNNLEQTIEIASQLLKIPAKILPATLTPSVLSAQLMDGRKIVGEHNIDSPRSGKFSPILKLSLSRAKPNPQAVKAINTADVLVFGPGDLYTSVLPNLVAPNILKAVNQSRAKKVFVGNLMTKDGQTNNFKASEFIWAVKKLVPDLDYAIFNSASPGKQLLKNYTHTKSFMVEIDKENLKQCEVKVILEKLLLKEVVSPVKGDVLQRSFLRHNSQKLAKIIYQLLSDPNITN
jgi:uncharacterized cofD-like protein